jgi:hypothetical protein
MATTDLLAFANAIASGAIRVVDLTQTLSPEFPTIVLPPEFGQCAFAVRCTWASLVLEQFYGRRAHRNAFRRSDPLGIRQGSAEQCGRYDSAGQVHRCLRGARLFGGGRNKS